MTEQEQLPKRPSTFPLFSKNLNLQPLNAIEYSHSLRKQFEDFIEAFKRRIEIEMTYSKSLESVSKTLDKYIKPGTELATSYISSAFKVQNEQRANQAKELAESLRTEISEVCGQMLKSNSSNVKRIEKELKRYYKQANNLQENYQSTFQNYEGISKHTQEMMITKNIMKHTTGIPQDKKIKLITKTMEGIRENKEQEKLYHRSVKQYNQFAAIYNQEVTVQLDCLEKQAREQLTLEADCLRKLIVCQISMFRNIEYDLINISKQMEALDTQRDIEAFVQQQKNSTENLIIFKLIDKKDDQLNTSTISNGKEKDTGTLKIEPKQIIGRSMLSDSLLYIEEEYFNWMLSSKKHKKIRICVEMRWKGLKQNMQKEEEVSEKTEENKGEEPKKEQIMSEEEIKKNIEDFFVLQSIIAAPQTEKTAQKQVVPNMGQLLTGFMEITQCIAEIWNYQVSPQKLQLKLECLGKYFSRHHLFRLFALLFIEEYRIQQKVSLISAQHSKPCGRLIKALATESYKKSDVFIIRGLLGLIFTFYWTEDGNKRPLYLNPDIYQCRFWKKHDLWAAEIFETTYEEMVNFSMQKGETQAETISREKNLIFSQLASFCHYMIMLGISHKTVRTIVGRYCRVYQMSDDQNTDLAKMITSINNQFKQMSSKMGKNEKILE